MGKETGRVPSVLVGIIIMIHHYNILDIIAIHHYHTPLFWCIIICLVHVEYWSYKGIAPKQDAAHEPECSHVEHLWETSYLNSLHFSPITVPVRCRLLNGGVQSVEWRV